tara:strand:- start:10497 stop:10817 length:321 start_codon:yes stop_codon:yes gene_type:complete
MASPSKAKGNRFERLIVLMTQAMGIACKRAYASNGAALGMHEEVDVLLGKSFKVQAKVRKAMGQWMIPSKHVNAQVIKADREEPLIVMRYDEFLERFVKKNKKSLD